MIVEQWEIDLSDGTRKVFQNPHRARWFLEAQRAAHPDSVGIVWASGGKWKSKYEVIGGRIDEMGEWVWSIRPPKP